MRNRNKFNSRPESGSLEEHQDFKTKSWSWIYIKVPLNSVLHNGGALELRGWRTTALNHPDVCYWLLDNAFMISCCASVSLSVFGFPVCVKCDSTTTLPSIVVLCVCVGSDCAAPPQCPPVSPALLVPHGCCEGPQLLEDAMNMPHHLGIALILSTSLRPNSSSVLHSISIPQRQHFSKPFHWWLSSKTTSLPKCNLINSRFEMLFVERNMALAQPWYCGKCKNHMQLLGEMLHL